MRGGGEDRGAGRGAGRLEEDEKRGRERERESGVATALGRFLFLRPPPPPWRSPGCAAKVPSSMAVWAERDQRTGTQASIFEMDMATQLVSKLATTLSMINTIYLHLKYNFFLNYPSDLQSDYTVVCS